jgi:DNA-binding HxlR family transcriptional regulator
MSTVVKSSGLPADAYCAKCPTRQVVDHIAGKWTVLIVDALSAGTMRYTEIKRKVEGVSQKMLTQTLRSLEADGFLTRTVHPTIPPQVEYTLTPLGHSLAGPISELRRWAETHINEIEEARARINEQADSGTAG